MSTSPLRFSQHYELAGLLWLIPVRFNQEGEIATQESTALFALSLPWVVRELRNERGAGNENRRPGNMLSVAVDSCRSQLAAVTLYCITRVIQHTYCVIPSLVCSKWEGRMQRKPPLWKSVGGSCVGSCHHSPRNTPDEVHSLRSTKFTAYFVQNGRAAYNEDRCSGNMSA